MIDIALFVELWWCFVWLAQKRPQNSILYAGGLVSAGYVAWQTSGWMSHWLISPSNPAFLWLERNLTTEAQAVTILSHFLPPQPVDTTITQTHWIALHVARTLVFCAVTLAVFITFAIVVSLRTAIWDLNPESTGSTRGFLSLSGLLAAVSSVYTVIVSVMLISDIAWIEPFHQIALLLGQSTLFHLYLQFLHAPHI